MKWNAFKVMPGKEYEIRARIKKIAPESEIFIPREYNKEIIDGEVAYKSDRLLPGYILVSEIKPVNWLQLKDSIRLVGQVYEEEISRLKAIESLRDEILERGSKILVIEGPFQGCKGEIKVSNGDKTFKCRLVFQGLEINATLKEDYISRIK